MIKNLSYYVYDEWRHSQHLQLVKKAKSINSINKAIEDWRKDSGVILHIVRANGHYPAKAIIRAEILGWSRDKLPSAYKGEYIKKIIY